MTPSQWHEIVDKVKAEYGNTGRWSNATDLAPRVQAVSANEVLRLLDRHAAEGNDHPPAPGALIAQARNEDQADPDVVQRLAEAYCDANGHAEAVIDGRPVVCARCKVRLDSER